jgi:hypothetical protein
MDKSPAFSGCVVSLVEDNGKWVVQKSCQPEYASRLKMQADKQILYKDLLVKENIEVPEVYQNEFSWFTMEYKPYLGYIEFVETRPVVEIKSSLAILLNYINTSIKEIIVWDFQQRNRAKEKEWSSFIKQRISNEYQSTLKRISKLEIPALPIGRCHGDLTMSNVMFGNSKIAFIDFADTPISSPILDIIKLKQDAKYNWTSFTTTKKHDWFKVELVNKWFDEQLNLLLSRNNLEIKEWKYWEAMNYLRIIPYVKEERILTYLETCIEDILC